MSQGQAKVHANGIPSLIQSQTYTSSSYSIRSQPSSRSSDTTQGTATSTLFPPPPPISMSMTTSPPPDPSMPRQSTNVMNKVGDKEQSLFQICVILRQRLSGVPGFDSFLEEEERGADEDTDPVTLLWRTFRRGYPLLALYNVLRPEKHIQPDLSNMSSELKKGKAMTFKFLNACIHDLKFKIEECFIILDLYGDDTTGFVRVTKTVTRMLDILVEQNIIEDTRRDSAEPGAGGKRSQRQHIVHELVNTERTYVQQLELLQAFQGQCQKTGVVPGDILHQIFLNLNGLLDFQRRFLIRVEQINAMPEDEQNWGKLFVLYNEAFSIYEPYITNQKQCEATVMREFDRLKLAGGSPELQGIVANPSTLYSFLMKPFQRLSKYPLLLDQLYKKGDLDQERKSDLLIGKECATAVLSRTNAAMEREDRLAAVEDLRIRVEEWKGHVLDDFGELLLFGTFTVLKSDGPSSKEAEYHVYFFEFILLCCKDADPNKGKVKNKNKLGLDRRIKPKLQLKGRIYMQNVTDVVCTTRQGLYTCQIFWNGDDSLEDFTIRYPSEDLAQKWFARFQEQRQAWLEHAKANAQQRVTSQDFAALQRNGAPRVTSHEFVSMQGHTGMENPYKGEEDELDDIETNTIRSAEGHGQPYQSMTDFGTASTGGWTGSQISLRSRSGTGESGQALAAAASAPIPMPPPSRTAPPRLPLGSIVPPIFDANNAAQFADSYFSPTEESPQGFSSRTSSSSGMYPFPRQGHFSEGGYPTPMPFRVGSKENMSQMQSQASNPRQIGGRAAYQSGSGVPSSLSTTRNRSVSSPNMNEAQRRTIDNSTRPPMPDTAPQQYSQYPSHPSIQRTHSNYTPTAGIDERLGAISPPMAMAVNMPTYSPASLTASNGFPMHPSRSQGSHYDHHPYPISTTTNSSRLGTPALLPVGTPIMMSSTSTNSPDSFLPPAAQLKIKVHAPAANQVLTLVVPANISYQSLKDRIDAKLQRSTNLSLTDRGGGGGGGAGGTHTTVRLKYLDEEDFINIGCDEDVQTAFETWREQKGDGVNGMGEIELFCQ